MIGGSAPHLGWSDLGKATGHSNRPPPFFHPGKKNDFEKLGRIWISLGRLCEELGGWLDQPSVSHWVN